MKTSGGQIFEIALIHARIEILFGESISAPRARRWRRAAGILPNARRCDYVQAVLFLSAAFLRRESPSVELAPFAVKVFYGRNFLRMQAELARCGALVIESAEPEVIGDLFWWDAADLIRDRVGQRPSEATIRRWCQTLDIAFSRSLPIEGRYVERLINYAKELKLGRKYRGKTLRARAKTKAA